MTVKEQRVAPTGLQSIVLLWLTQKIYTRVSVCFMNVLALYIPIKTGVSTSHRLLKGVAQRWNSIDPHSAITQCLGVAAQELQCQSAGCYAASCLRANTPTSSCYNLCWFIQQASRHCVVAAYIGRFWFSSKKVSKLPICSATIHRHVYEKTFDFCVKAALPVYLLS